MAQPVGVQLDTIHNAAATQNSVDPSAGPYIDNSLMFEAKMHEFWIQSIDANQETALYQMDKTTKAQDAARRWRDIKSQIDAVIAEVSTAANSDATGTLPPAVRDALWNDDVYIEGKSWRDHWTGVGAGHYTLGQLRSISNAVDTHISSFTDMGSKNTIETQKAITNVQTCVQGATGQVSQSGRQAQEVISNMHR
jgi:hypothetical protein